MTKRQTTRSWFARCCYPGLHPFVFGTAFTTPKEGEEAARLAITRLMDEVLPIRPDILSIEPGAVFVEVEQTGVVYA